MFCKKRKKCVKKILKVHDGRKVIGIIAESYDDLISKCQQKLNTGSADATLTLDDGTEIDEEYFEVLEDKEHVFYNYKKSPSSEIVLRLEEFIKTYIENNYENLDSKLQEILQIKSLPEMLRALCLLKSRDSKCLQSTCKQDPDWFQGMVSKYTTKEEVLRNSAESRMRSYFQKFKKDLEEFKENPIFQNLVENLQAKLKNKRFNSFYFDRSSKTNEQLCDSDGLFSCYGDFLSPCCPTGHTLNPYESRESRILFSTWNFDHVIEKSRAIIPAVAEALRSSDSYVLNADYVFELLFQHCTIENKIERGNIKLVHIVCHNKNPHDLKCDNDRLLNNSQVACKRLKKA